MSDDLRSVVLGAGVVVGVALLVVLAVVVGAVALDADPAIDADEDMDTDGPPPEYDPANVIAEPIPSEGEVTVNGSLYAESVGERRLVVIERGNTVQRERVRKLVEAIVLAGHEVRMRDGDDLDEVLPDADAYVRVAPDNALSSEEVDLVSNFTDQGGRVVILGEPNRKRITVTALGASVTAIRMQTTQLAARYGVTFETRYLYDTATSDGNFKNVLARPTDAADAPDLDRVAFDTATAVTVRPGLNATNGTNATRPPNGTVLLRTTPTARLDNGGRADAYPVAVRSGPMLAVGDTSFVMAGRHNVAGNEEFVGYVTEFALRGDRPASANLSNASSDNLGEGASGSNGLSSLEDPDAVGTAPSPAARAAP